MKGAEREKCELRRYPPLELSLYRELPDRVTDPARVILPITTTHHPSAVLC